MEKLQLRQLMRLLKNTEIWNSKGEKMILLVILIMLMGVMLIKSGGKIAKVIGILLILFFGFILLISYWLGKSGPIV